MGEDVLDRLSRANPIPDGLPAPALELLLEQLEQPEQRPRRSTARRFSRALPLAVGIGLVLLVAVTALMRAGQRPPHPSSTDHVPMAARQLVEELGVLGRQQTPADRDLPDAVLHVPGVVRSLTRLVLRDGGIRVFVIVRWAPQFTQAIASTVAVTRGGEVSWLGNHDASGIRRPGPPGPTPPAIVPIHASIVPDGVAAVAWTFSRVLSHTSTTRRLVSNGSV